VGAALRALRISVTENLEAPLLVVASVCSSGDTARPKGFGAPTFTSTPAGVRKRPFGRIAPDRPSIVVESVVGSVPAGAAKSTNRDGAARPGRDEVTASCWVVTAALSSPLPVFTHEPPRPAST